MRADDFFRTVVLFSTLASAISCNKIMATLRPDYEESPGSRHFSSSYDSLDRDDEERNRAQNLSSNSDSSELLDVSTANAVNFEPERKRFYGNGRRATRDDFIDRSQDEGSLWASSGQTNYFFTKNKVRSPGDLVNVTLEKDLYRELVAEIKRNLSPREKIDEIRYAQEILRQRYLLSLSKQSKDSLTTTASAPDRTPAAIGSPNPDEQGQQLTPLDMSEQAYENKMLNMSMDDVDLPPALAIKAGDTMLAEVVERFPNGNYKIRGIRRILYKRGIPRVVSLTGVAKSTDFSEENDTISSGRLYEYRIEIAH